MTYWLRYGHFVFFWELLLDEFFHERQSDHISANRPKKEKLRALLNTNFFKLKKSMCLYFIDVWPFVDELIKKELPRKDKVAISQPIG